MLKAWSKKTPTCIKCGTTRVPYSRGLCKICYKRIFRPPTRFFNPRREIKKNITRERLVEKYYEKGESLQDIASDLKCSRQYILKLMKLFKIERRSKESARDFALDKGKIAYVLIDSWGDIRTITHKKLQINRSFFQNWSDGLAYILGMIYTDGNLLEKHFDNKRNKTIYDYKISISQKDPYILNRIKDLLSLSVSLFKGRNNKDGYLYQLTFRDKEVYKKLESFGLCPNKSLKITFPDIPQEYLGGFIRGLFDGDGTYSTRRARLTTGSKDFANGLMFALEAAGFRTQIRVTPKSHSRKNPYYTLEVSSRKANLLKFHQFLYSNATIFIPRKREEFEKYLPSVGEFGQTTLPFTQ